MEDVRNQAVELQNQVAAAMRRLDIDALTLRKSRLDEQAAAPDFWTAG